MARATDPWSVGPVRVRRVRGPRADGLVYWRATVRDDEGERQLWAGWCRREDPAVSRELLRLAGGGPPEPEPAGKVLHLLGSYRAEIEARRAAGELSPSALKGYLGALRYLATGIGEVGVDDLDATVIRSYLRARQIGQVRPERIRWRRVDDAARWVGSAATLHLELVVLQAAWSWGRRRGLVEGALEVPAAPRGPRIRGHYTPTVEEVEAVLAELREPWQRAMVRILLGTGARAGEIADLTWDRVDLERGLAELAGKTGPRTIPLLGEARAAIESLAGAAADGRVLPVRATTARGIGEALAEACDRAGVERWSPHALRRLAVDRLYEAGVDVGVVARLLGQSPAVALAAYRQPRQTSLVAALESAGMGSSEQGQVVQLRRHTSASQGGERGGRGR